MSGYELKEPSLTRRQPSPERHHAQVWGLQAFRRWPPPPGLPPPPPPTPTWAPAKAAKADRRTRKKRRRIWGRRARRESGNKRKLSAENKHIFGVERCSSVLCPCMSFYTRSFMAAMLIKQLMCFSKQEMISILMTEKRPSGFHPNLWGLLQSTDTQNRKCKKEKGISLSTKGPLFFFSVIYLKRQKRLKNVTVALYMCLL